MDTRAMPRAKNPMSWVPSRKCWRKMYRGKVYEFYPYSVGLPANPESSRKAMKEYWQEQLAKWYAENSPVEKAKWRLEQSFENHPEGNAFWNVATLLKAIASLPFSQEIKNLYGEKAIGQDRWKRINPNKTTSYFPEDALPENMATVFQLGEFMKMENVRHENKQISMQTVNNTRRDCDHLKQLSCLPESVSGLTVVSVKRIHSVLSSLPLALQTRKMRWTTFQRFCEFACSNCSVPVPGNLRDKLFRFGSDSITPTFWTVGEFQAEYNRADSLGKLILCLASNCGLYACDMANVQYTGNGTLTVERVKTGKHGAKMVFHLWPETAELLVSHGHLLADMYSKTLLDSKTMKTDKIGPYLKGLKTPIKNLRHTSAQFLEESEQWHTYKDHFLCHAASKISDRNYTVRTMPKELFDYLHSRYFA